MKNLLHLSCFINSCNRLPKHWAETLLRILEIEHCYKLNRSKNKLLYYQDHETTFAKARYIWSSF